MNWTKLTDDSQLDTIRAESDEQPILIFKHSATCPISTMALNRMERNWKDNDGIKAYFLDLLAHRALSGQVSREFGVEHQSPQILLIRNGACMYDASHTAISFNSLTANV